MNIKKSFTAKANINFVLNLSYFAEKRAWNKTQLQSLRDINPNVLELHSNHSYYNVIPGMELKFGESIVLNDDNGDIEVYPFEFYDYINKNPIDMPSPLFGEVSEKIIDNTFNGLPREFADKFKKELKENQLLDSRFIKTYCLSKVE